MEDIQYESNHENIKVSMKTVIQDGDVTTQDEEIIFDPYNSINKEITLNDVQSILMKYGVWTGTVFNINLINHLTPCY